MDACIHYDDLGKDVRREPIPDDLKELAEEYRTKLVEAVAEQDDALMEKYLMGEELTEEEILQIKKEYISQLIKIQEGYDNGQLAMRDTYQRISASIREFVFKVTDIEVHNYTLTDIKRLNMPVLAELVEEYYRPEFEKESLGDVKNSIEKTKRAIERWN